MAGVCRGSGWRQIPERRHGRCPVAWLHVHRDVPRATGSFRTGHVLCAPDVSDSALAELYGRITLSMT